MKFATYQEIEAFIGEFEACRIPKAEWTHHAHLVAGLWYLSHYALEDALTIVRQRIRAYNESVGGINSDDSGYHETITRFYLISIAAHLAQSSDASLADSLALLLESPLANAAYPLSFYSRERLFSVAARRGWLEPDIASVRVPI